MRLFFCQSFQPGEVYAVAGGGVVAFFEEHRHVDGGVGDGACFSEVFVCLLLRYGIFVLLR